MSTQLTFRTRDGKQKTVTLTHYQSIFNAICPVDGTQLIQTIGDENYFVSCGNCERTYYAGNYPSVCTQERVNQDYKREIADTKEELVKLRREFREREAGLSKKIEELENPFTQEQMASSSQ